MQRKERQKAELREQILTAARDIIISEGFDGLTMRKIADKIEYAPGTIYLHFASRNEIGLQLVREGFSELLRFMAPAAQIADPFERLMAIGHGYVEFGMSQPEWYRLIFMTDKSFSNEVMQHMGMIGDDPEDPGDRAFVFVENTVKELVESGVFKPVDPQLGAFLFWSASHGIVSLHLACQDGIGLPDAREATAAMHTFLASGFLAK